MSLMRDWLLTEQSDWSAPRDDQAPKPARDPIALAKVISGIATGQVYAPGSLPHFSPGHGPTRPAIPGERWCLPSKDFPQQARPTRWRYPPQRE